MNISINTVKKLILKEIKEHYQTACRNCYNDVQRAFIHRGYHQVILPMLEQAQTEDDLQEILSVMDYRMSVDEWIESL